MDRKAFTMIEIIFSIVIIGILTMVALPRLTAFRDSANSSLVLSALGNCVDEAGVEYVKTGSFHHITNDEDAMTDNCRKANRCFGFIEDDLNASLTVTIDTNETSPVCKEAQDIAEKNMLASTHTINF